VLVKIALGAFHGDLFRGRNFSANPEECGGTCVHVTGMRSLERPMKILAKAAVHRSTSILFTCAGQAAGRQTEGDLCRGRAAFAPTSAWPQLLLAIKRTK
jgi:hypothetical protein